ncbi:MAG: hypothetical protein R3F61_19345 [Myxococcota bacterium]
MGSRWAIGCVLAVFVYVWRAWPSLMTTVDDAWISARYAANAAAGHGLVYNAGEPPIEGFTNLLWTLWLALGVLTGLRLDQWMVGSGLVLGGLTVVFGGLLARALVDREHWWVPGIASLLIALDSHHAVVSTNGLESAMFDAAVLGAAWAVLASGGSRPAWRWLAGLSVGLLGAIRPEGFVVGAALVALSATPVLQRTRSVKESFLHDVLPVLVPYGALGIALEIWRVTTYGAWVPNTFAAKAKGGWSTFIDSNLAYLSPDAPFWIASAVLGALALMAGWRDVRRWVLAGAALAVVAIAFRVELWMPGGRLLVPAFLLFAVLVASAATHRFGAVVAGLATLGALISPFTSLETVVRRYDRAHSVVMWNGTAVAAIQLAKHAKPGSWLAIRDAGVLAHFVGTDVLVAELHNRALTQLHPDGADADTFAFTPVDPEIIVLTQARVDTPTIRYGRDRAVLERTTVPYRYLGRVHQHYHRYYDIYVREDSGIPDLPPNVVENHSGPPAPRGARPRTPLLKAPIDR